VVADPPVSGAIVCLAELFHDKEVQPAIYSSRSSQDGGIKAMQDWLIQHFITAKELSQIEFPTQKPAAFLTIDDRAMCFVGEFPTIEEMLAFVPWNK